jgi:hypothetical protein
MQKQRHVPATSLAAFRNQKAKGTIETVQEKIMRTMNRIKWGNRDKIAAAARMEPVRVWRRLSELEKAGRIVKTSVALRSPQSGELQAVYKLPKYKLKLSA